MVMMLGFVASRIATQYSAPELANAIAAAECVCGAIRQGSRNRGFEAQSGHRVKPRLMQINEVLVVRGRIERPTNWLKVGLQEMGSN